MVTIEGSITQEQDYDGSKIAVGMLVRRVLARTVSMILRVTEVTDTTVTCRFWTFDRTTGAEIDEELGWGTDRTGSVLVGMGTEGANDA